MVSERSGTINEFIDIITIIGKVTIVNAIPLNLPIIPSAVEVSNPAAANLLGTKRVEAVPNKFPKNPFKHRGNAITKTLNNS